MTPRNRQKKVELETLKTFREQIPSIYFNHLDNRSYKKFKKLNEAIFRDSLNFPPKMFLDTNLIDFGGGTGHNTICFSDWGAKCTIVELNNDALTIAKDVFRKCSKHPGKHRFINSSIFDFNEKDKNYDIVVCRGVLAHTGLKEKAFKKICKFVKKGGYLIFGDPNKAGSFQNMLQRYVLYKFSNNNKDIIKNSEILFKTDIDRSQKASARTRKQIIFDRWVVQSQDNPSFTEINQWLSDCNLKLYSACPTVHSFFLSDSFMKKNEISSKEVNYISALFETLWMIKTQDDKNYISFLKNDLKEVTKNLNNLVTYVTNCNKNTKIETDKFSNLSREYIKSFSNLKLIYELKTKLENFILESNKLIELTNNRNFDELKKFIKKCSFLFKGPSGVRHVDFIAYKSKD